MFEPQKTLEINIEILVGDDIYDISILSHYNCDIACKMIKILIFDKVGKMIKILVFNKTNGK